MANGRDWRETLPIDVDVVRSLPEVAAMTGAERAGFMWLLFEQWRGEDGYLPADEEFIRKASGLREEWNASQRAIMRMFPVCGEGVCANPDVRAAWERKRWAHQAMSEGGRRGFESRQERQERDGSYMAGRSVADATVAQPVSPVNTRTSVCVALIDKSKGSVIRASDDRNTLTEETPVAMPEIQQYGPRHNDNAFKIPRAVLTPTPGEKGPHSASNFDAAARQEREPGGIPAKAVEVLEGERVESEWRPVPNRLVTQAEPWFPAGQPSKLFSFGAGGAGGTEVFAVGFEEWSAKQAAEVAGEPQDEKQGAGVPSDADGERVEALVSHAEAILTPSDLSSDESDDIEAMKVAAQGGASGRVVRRAPAPPRPLAKRKEARGW